MKIGPTKVSVKGDAVYDAKTGKLIKDGLSTPQAVAEFAAHHYVALPVVDNAGRPWTLDGKLIYCLRGTQYETLDKELPQARRCPECGGLAVPAEEMTVERDCVRCTQCSHEFDARLEMMES
jgi:rubredoxin